MKLQKQVSQDEEFRLYLKALTSEEFSAEGFFKLVYI